MVRPASTPTWSPPTVPPPSPPASTPSRRTSTGWPAPLNVVWPDDVVFDAAARASGSRARFAVLGVGAGSLQLGFCLVLAAARRPTQRQHGTLLARRGARRTQVLGIATLQAAGAVLVGLVAGTAAGLAVVLLLTRGVVPDPGGAAVRALASAWPVVLGLAVAAVLGSVLLAAGPALRAGALRGVLAAVVLLAGGFAVLALVRPTADPAPRCRSRRWWGSPWRRVCSVPCCGAPPSRRWTASPGRSRAGRRCAGRSCSPGADRCCRA